MEITFTVTVENTLTIEMTPQGALKVNGPIENPLFALGLLEMAKQAIHQHNSNKAMSRIIPALAGVPLPGLRRNGG